MEPVTCLVPSILGSEHVLGTLFSVINQSYQPLRIIVGDVSDNGLDTTFAVKRWCRTARIDVLRLAPRTSLHHNRRLLLEAAGDCGLVWFVDDDLWPTYNCLQQLLHTRSEYNATAVAGAKIEVTRRNVFQGKDWNLAGDCVRKQRLPWTDGCNLLIDAKLMQEGIAFADHVFGKKEACSAGEDISCTARIGDRMLLIGDPDAVAYHFPLHEERWTDLDASDNMVLEYLGKNAIPPRHLEWLERSLKQSEW